jgi:group I intron endonuclease
MGIIYCYTNLINNKKYIGQTINPEQRFSAHKSNYQNPNNNEYNSLLHKAFRKYGYDNFKYEILIQNIEDVELLNKLEIYYINFYNTQIPNGYNVEAGGKNSAKPKSLEHRKKEIWG